MFDILICDAPWSYDNKRTGGSLKSGSGQHYETLSYNDLMNLEYPIQKLMNKNSLAFIWVTNSFIKHGLTIMKMWGFDYKTMITWVKKNYGLGYWFRGKTEHCLFGVKGKIPALRINMPNVIISDKVTKHSEKPEEFYEYVSTCLISLDHKLHKRINVLELFARQEREGWTCIGKEITGNDIKEDLRELV